MGAKDASLRLVLYANVGCALEVLRRWLAGTNHEVAVLVTSPRRDRSDSAHLEALGAVEGEFPLTVVRRAADARDAVAAAGADLAIVYTFQFVPDDLAALPRAGTVNLHPTLLPAYRGPNGYRAIYEGEPRLGSTLHRIVNQFDAGPILAQSCADMPVDIRPATVWDVWERTMLDVLDAGVPLAAAGVAGRCQPAEAEGYASNFELRDALLDDGLSVRAFCSRATALLLAEQEPLVRLAGRHRRVLDLRACGQSPAPPGEGWVRLDLTDGSVDLAVAERS
jgi:methionyl-tRNA formyltransferase